MVVRLDPGLAFGTGTHPTTALCLQFLDAMPLAGRTVIDYGCGSGILGIAALKLGASQRGGRRLDPQALLATRENAVRNAVSARLRTQGVAAALEPADLRARQHPGGAPHRVGADPHALHAALGGDLILRVCSRTQAHAVKAAYARLLIWCRWSGETTGAASTPGERPSLYTQCAKCETVFRLSAEVLRAAGGQVRCGRCGEVFNALARLAEDASRFPAGEVESALELEARADEILQSTVPPVSRAHRTGDDARTSAPPTSSSRGFKCSCSTTLKRPPEKAEPAPPREAIQPRPPRPRKLRQR